MFTSSTAIWATGSVASRARSQQTRSKCEWIRVWTIKNVDDMTQNEWASRKFLYFVDLCSKWLDKILENKAHPC